MEQVEIDAGIQHYYSSVFDEDARLTTRSAQSALEFIRVQELIRDRIAPGSRVLDVGGATGIHAAPLAAAGHHVTLIDPVEAQVSTAKRHGSFAAEVGDARRLQFVDDSFDVALLFGPLYHLLPAGHFHTAEEFEDELRTAGLTDVELHAIEGPAGLALEQLASSDDELLQAALTVVRQTGHLPGIRDMSNHLMAIGRVQ